MKEKYLDSLTVNGKQYYFYNIVKFAEEKGIDLIKLPFSMKVLLENLLRNFDGVNVQESDFDSIKEWIKNPTSDKEIAFAPARVLMQDFTGVPAVVDLAAMRDAIKKLGGDPNKVNPLAPVDLVIDHSVQVDVYASGDSFKKNVELEMERNIDRYEFLKWGQESFSNFKVVPPGTGICHQVNLEYLARVVWSKEVDGKTIIYPDTLVGTDSHTTMVNGLAVLGWGVGGIEAEAAMLGQAISMVLPEVIGFHLTGSLKEGTTATDLVLTVTQMLRQKGVVNKFVEFYGEGLNKLPLADRATIANMAPEYGATCGFFPIDNETLKYMHLSGRNDDLIKLVEEYAKKQNFWRDGTQAKFTDTLELDLSKVEPSLAGPKRPQDRVSLATAKDSILKVLAELSKKGDTSLDRKFEVQGGGYKLANSDVVIAAITSCTNTSNPSVLIAAGLIARKARKLGIMPKPWVKTSLAPGSQVVTEYLNKSGLTEDLDALGFNLVGYGCTTCIGNSGPLKKEIEDSISANDVVVASVLSGNRNFEGRVHPLVKANYLASPPLVVIYSLVGTMNTNVATDPIANDKDGKPVYLKDLWPTTNEINEIVNSVITPEMFKTKYSDVFKGDKLWQDIKTSKSLNYSWNEKSTYIQNPPYFEGMSMQLTAKKDVMGAKVLALLADSITTDHISPAGNISKTSPAAKYLVENGVQPRDFNSYGARRGNHQVMMRGTFANIRIKNEMLNGVEGGLTKHDSAADPVSIFDAAMKYKSENKDLVIFAGKEYGTGSSRDWAAKGTLLLGVKAVVAESFERIHRSNLVGMGVLPLVYKNGENRKTLNIKGDETIDIIGLSGEIKPKMELKLIITRKDGSKTETTVLCRIDTKTEVEYYLHGGILPFMVRNMSK